MYDTFFPATDWDLFGKVSISPSTFPTESSLRDLTAFRLLPGVEASLRATHGHYPSAGAAIDFTTSPRQVLSEMDCEPFRYGVSLSCTFPAGESLLRANFVPTVAGLEASRRVTHRSCRRNQPLFLFFRVVPLVPLTFFFILFSSSVSKA